MRPLRVAFVINRIGVVDLQSLPLVAALARAGGHRVILVEYGTRPKKALRELARFAPDIVAYSICSNETVAYLAINRQLRKALRFFAVFGGAHPTYTPSFIHEDGVDAACRGEGDIAFPLFLDRFGSDAMYEVPNFSFKMADGMCRENPLTDRVSDLDSFPFPARDLVYAKSAFMADNPIKSFIAGRGCPFSCAHCFNNAYNQLYRGKGRIVRMKSVSYVLAEIQDVARRYPLSFVRFHDDVFGLDAEWLREFAVRFPKAIGLPFSCYVHPHMVSEEYVRLLKAAGCHAVCTAIECGNERIRNDILCRCVSNEEILAACERFKKAGIRVFSFNMVGLPGETEEDMLETIRLNRRITVDFADVSVFQPLPGTRAFEYCKAQGYLADADGHFDNVYTESSLNLDPALKQRIYLVHKLFLLLVDHPGAEAIFRHWPNTRLLNGPLNLFYRFHYGYCLHGRIYKSCIPFRVRLRGAPTVLFSKNRI
jgi:radical SAM superfamily enzyme YgiQ (UPF0313 family)